MGLWKIFDAYRGLKLRKADGNVSPIWAFIPEPLIDAGNPHKIRGSGFFGGCCRLVLNCVVWY